MSRGPVGLQARFMIGVACVLSLALAVLVVLGLRQAQMQREVAELGRSAVHDVATQGLAERGEGSTRWLAEALANPLYYSDLAGIGSLLEVAQRQPDISYVLVFDADGMIVHDGSRDILRYGQTMDDALAPQAIANRELLVQRSSELMDVSQAIFVGDQHLGGVRVGYSLQGVQADEKRAADSLQQRLSQLARQYMAWFLALFAALLAACVASIWYVQRWLVTPIRQLAASARAIGAGDYDSRRPVSHRGDEVGELVRAFSKMGDSIASHARDVRRIAYTDALTGLVNRLAFRESLDRSFVVGSGAGKPLALLFLDLDGFKPVNDELGHDAGDAVLVLVAERIRDAVARFGGPGALAGRFGGDEFVILLQRGDVGAAAERIAEQLVRELRHPMQVQDGKEARISASIGIALFPDDAPDAVSLKKKADQAMYQVKLTGKNGWRFYDKSMG